MSPTAQTNALLLGAYAMVPGDPADAAEFYGKLAGLKIGGLEVPLPDSGLDGGTVVDVTVSDAAVTELVGRLQPGWRVLLTCIPVVMGRLAADSSYGLASADESSRRNALADVRRGVDLAQRLRQATGQQVVSALQVHSAPGPKLGNADAFSRSLAEISEWDLAGAGVIVEHCDALVEGQSAVKGFLTLEEEIAAIRAAGEPDCVGLGINWGRSAIEGRDAATPVEHVALAAREGLLRSVVFSGATDVRGDWGEAWGDTHIPSRGADPALAASAASLLGDEEIAATLALVAERTILAVKVSVRPRDASVDQRLAVARAVLSQVEAHRG